MSIIKIAIDGSRLLTLDVEEYVKGVLPAEMPSHWDKRALRAQSLVIRTYGLAKMAERGFVYADTRDQVFNPSKCTPRTDAIVEATRGIVGIYKGKIVPTWYHASCGGETLDDWGKWLRVAKCPCGRDKHGHSRGMCQYGAQALAEKGWACQAILDFYYKDVAWLGNYGEKNMSKLSISVQKCGELRRGQAGEWVVRHILEAGVWAVVLIDPDVLGNYNPFPGVHAMGRLVFDGDPDLILVQRGAAGAREYVDMCAPRQDAVPWVRLWHAPNEPFTGDPENPNDLDPIKRLTEFTVELVRLNRQRGIDTGVGVFGTSQPAGPKVNPLPTIVRKWEIFGPACREAAVLVLHEYGMDTLNPTPENEWHIEHYKRGVKALQNAGFRVPPIWITEHGIDRGGGQTTDGWRIKLGGDEAEYMRQLATRDIEYSADPVIQIVTPFVWLDWNWPSFTIIESMSERIMRYIVMKGAYQPGGMPAPPPVEPEPPSTGNFSSFDRDQAEYQFELFPATMKVANQLGYIWQKEWEFNWFYFCLVYLPEDHKYKVLKLDPATWQVVGTIDL